MTIVVTDDDDALQCLSNRNGSDVSDFDDPVTNNWISCDPKKLIVEYMSISRNPNIGMRRKNIVVTIMMICL